VTDHIYVAIRGGLVKVGIAVNPTRRIRQQRAQMFWCSVLCEGAGAVEYAACQAMRRRVVPGKREWFTVRPEVALRVVLRAIRRSRMFNPIYQRARDEWAPRLVEGGGK